MKKLLVIVLFLPIACNAFSSAGPTRPAVITQVALPIQAPTQTASPKPTSSATPTATQAPTITPDLKETALRASETGIALQLEQLQQRALQVCQGQGIAEAGDYEAAASELNPAVICLPSGTPACCLEPSNSFGIDVAARVDLSRLDVREVGQLHLVICLETKERLVQTCKYKINYESGSTSIEGRRVQVTYVYTIYSALKRSKVATVSLAGGMPPPCPENAIINNNIPPTFIGAFPTGEELFKKLNPYLHLPTQ